MTQTVIQRDDWREALRRYGLEAWSHGGHGRRLGFGRRPALILVDLVDLYVAPSGQLYVGSMAESALGASARLIAMCREKRLPIIYTTAGQRPSQAERGLWAEKVASAAGEITGTDTFPRSIAPNPTDLIINKDKASAFFGTTLAATLTYMQIDTLIMGGVTTSGCVRATVVDAFGWNFRPIVVAECTGDRRELSHLVSLFDMDMKYADVLSLTQVSDEIGKLDIFTSWKE